MSVIFLDSCTVGREDSDIARLDRDVKAFANETHSMNLVRVDKRDLNYLSFGIDTGFVITDKIITSFSRRFPGTTLGDRVWRVPIDQRVAYSRGERSRSPPRDGDVWMYEVKMVIIYTATILLFAIKLAL
jgi:hypothetical protein